MTSFYCFQSFIQILESIVTIIAIIVGGIWTYILFIRNREKYPKADITHKIQKIKRESDIIVRLTIGIENLGKVKLPIQFGEIRLQQIKPSTSTIAEAVERFQKIGNTEKNEIEWPLLEERGFSFKKDKYELEPTEKENFEFDFVLGLEIEVIQFYTHIENAFKEDKGWNYTSIHELN